MTRFTVVWHDDALNALASCWLRASDREAVAAAANAVDTELADDPATKGEELREGLRTIDVLPLRAFFDIYEGDRRVEVQFVRYLGTN